MELPQGGDGAGWQLGETRHRGLGSVPPSQAGARGSHNCHRDVGDGLPAMEAPQHQGWCLTASQIQSRVGKLMMTNGWQSTWNYLEGVEEKGQCVLLGPPQCNSTVPGHPAIPQVLPDSRRKGVEWGENKMPQKYIALTQHDDPRDWALTWAFWILQFITGLLALEAFAQTLSVWVLAEQYVLNSHSGS